MIHYHQYVFAIGYVGHRRAGVNIINNNNHKLTTVIRLDFENTTKQQNIRRKQTQKAVTKGKWGRPR